MTDDRNQTDHRVNVLLARASDSLSVDNFEAALSFATAALGLSPHDARARELYDRAQARKVEVEAAGARTQALNEPTGRPERRGPEPPTIAAAPAGSPLLPPPVPAPVSRDDEPTIELPRPAASKPPPQTDPIPAAKPADRTVAIPRVAPQLDLQFDSGGDKPDDVTVVLQRRRQEQSVAADVTVPIPRPAPRAEKSLLEPAPPLLAEPPPQRGGIVRLGIVAGLGAVALLGWVIVSMLRTPEPAAGSTPPAFTEQQVTPPVQPASPAAGPQTAGSQQKPPATEPSPASIAPPVESPAVTPPAATTSAPAEPAPRASATPVRQTAPTPTKSAATPARSGTARPADAAGDAALETRVAPLRASARRQLAAGEPQDALRIAQQGLELAPKDDALLAMLTEMERAARTRAATDRAAARAAGADASSLFSAGETQIGKADRFSSTGQTADAIRTLWLAANLFSRAVAERTPPGRGR